MFEILTQSFFGLSIIEFFTERGGGREECVSERIGEVKGKEERVELGSCPFSSHMNIDSRSRSIIIFIQIFCPPITIPL